MCETCGYSAGHHYRCPEYEGKTIFTCDRCGVEIYEGDRYIEFGGLTYCSDLIEAYTKRQIMEFFGGKIDHIKGVEILTYNNVDYDVQDLIEVYTKEELIVFLGGIVVEEQI